MASGLACVVVDDGGPGGLVGERRGIKVALVRMIEPVQRFRSALESLAEEPSRIGEPGPATREFTLTDCSWLSKARTFLEVDRWVSDRRR